jgi:hypothetical protein
VLDAAQRPGHARMINVNFGLDEWLDPRRFWFLDWHRQRRALDDQRIEPFVHLARHRVGVASVGWAKARSVVPKVSAANVMQPSVNSLRTKFPANRENNREFCRIRPSMAIFMSDHCAHSISYSGNPCATEQGISERVSGKVSQGTGNGHAAISQSQCGASPWDPTFSTSNGNKTTARDKSPLGPVCFKSRQIPDLHRSGNRFDAVRSQYNMRETEIAH